MKKIVFLMILIFLVGDLQSAENRTVVEGRVWDYYEHGNNYGEPYDFLREGYHFDGTHEFNGIEYNVFRNSDSSPVAYMREEDNKVFLYCGDGIEGDVPYPMNPEMGDSTTENEILLYNFNLKKGDKSIYPGFDDMCDHTYFFFDVEIVSTGEMDYKSNNFSYQDFYVKGNYYNEDKPYRNIEGLGNIQGLLPFPQFANVSSGLTKRWESLLRVSDSDGNIIYENEELLSSLACVGEISANTPDEEIFDLHGRRVSNPIRGSVYIRGGKKYIAR